MAKALRAQFGISDVMKNAMDAVDFFRENPVYQEQILESCLSSLEDTYVRQAYQAVGRKEIEESEAIQAVFAKYFGSNGRYVFRLFCDWHDTLPAVDDLLDRMNTYEFWDDAAKQGRVQFLEK